MENHMMGKENRRKLKEQETIRLARSADGANAEDCTILFEEGEGGTTVCYSALYGGKKGRLKEFYPTEASYGKRCRLLALLRNEENQLVPMKPEMEDIFQKMCEDFTNAYKILDRIKQREEEREIINNYLPAYLLLYGRAECSEGLGSVYVWTPDDTVGKQFSEYLEEVRKYPTKEPLKKLCNVISALSTLTDCVQILHSAGLLHLDIKPSNFLVSYNSRLDINAAQISLFDIDSICSVDSEYHRVSGTDGYRAPEVDRGHAENRSDIYSIGTMLFQAVVHTEEGVYRSKNYNELERLVAGSAFINAIVEPGNTFLQEELVKILKRCLAFRTGSRYGCCEELQEDLRLVQMALLQEITERYLKSKNCDGI